MSHTDLLTAVRAADPIDPADSDAWLHSDAAAAMLARIVTTPATDTPPRPRPRHRRNLRVISSLAVVVAGGTATAYATGILGGPAPERVQQHLAGLDSGMPADLRYNADVDNARAVATSPHGTLYLADTAGGGYCIEVASDVDRPRGASCITAAELSQRPLDVIAPIPDFDSSPLLVAGRANDERITALRATFTDGSSVDITLGLDRAWLLEIATAQHDTALRDGLRVVGVDDNGQTVVSRTVPALHDDDPLGTAHDNEQPIVVMTTSDGDDLTRVLAISGRVNVAGVDRFELRWPDGRTTVIPLTGTGRYRLDVPATGQDDLCPQPGALVAIRDGHVVASTPVASVAYWRGRNG